MKVDAQFDLLEMATEYRATTQQVTYKFFGASVCLKTDKQNLIDFSDLYFQGYFERTSDTDADFSVTVNSDPEAFTVLWKTLSLQHPAATGDPQVVIPGSDLDILIQQIDETQPSLLSILLVDKRQPNVTLMLPGYDDDLKYTPMRLVRMIMTVLLLRRGMLSVHGACIVKAGVGVCLVGNKRSGKTTTMINALLHGNYAFLSNSRIIVDHDHGSWLAHGLPIAAGIRIGTLRHFPSLHCLLTNYSELHKDNRTLNKEWLDHSDTRLYVQPQQLAKLFRCSITPRTAIKCFVFPEICSTRTASTLMPLTATEAKSRLSEQYLSELLPDQAYWNVFFGISADKSDVLSRLANDIPMYKLIQNAGTNDQSLRLLDSLCTS